MHRPCLFLGVDVAVFETLQVAIEQDADQFTFFVDRWAAGIAAVRIGGGYEVERRTQIQGRLRLPPRGWKPKGFLAGGMFVEAGERSGVGHRLASDTRVAFHRPVREARCKRRVGILIWLRKEKNAPARSWQRWR